MQVPQRKPDLAPRAKGLMYVVGVSIVVSLLMLPRLTDVAAFCDEILIGMYAANVFSLESLFYDHFGTTAGILPILTTAPFVTFFGLNDFTIRLPSLAFTIASCLLLWGTLARLKAPVPWLGALAFLATPQVLHMARINFGHAPSLFFVSLGLYFWSSPKRVGKNALGAGISFGFAAYGYPGYMVSIPLLIVVMLICGTTSLRRWGNESQFSRNMAITKAVVLVPIMVQAIVSPTRFFARANLKNQTDSALLSLDTLVNAVQNYPKYIRLDYLFVDGESAFAQSEIQRHSLFQSGILPWVLLPVALACTFRFISTRSNYPRKWAIPFILLLWFAPLPDLLTTTPMNPPYSFALAMSTFTIPFVVSAGVADLGYLLNSLLGRTLDIVRPMTILVVVQTVILVVATLPIYPFHSSGFWGWQYGMEPIIGYYEEHQIEYSVLRIDPWFNQPKTLATYHLDDERLLDTITFEVSPVIGEYEPGTLVAIGAEYSSIDRYEDQGWTVLETIFYPNGEDAWYMITPPPQ